MLAEIIGASGEPGASAGFWRLARWRVLGVYPTALLIFAASRLVVVLGVTAGKLLPPRVDPFPWSAGPQWYYRLLRWDSGWYAGIVRDGYHYSSDPSAPSAVVFYPLYPLLCRALVSLFGVSVDMALLLVSNIASVAVALLMTKLVKDELGDEVALLSMACFCFFPFSLFLSTGYTEPVFLAFALLSLILLRRQIYVAAAVAAGLAAATRSTGIVLLPVILFEMARRRTLPLPRLLPRMALCAVLAASGLLAFMVYLWIAFGNPLALAAGQAAWHGELWSERLLSALTLGPFLRPIWHDDLLLTEIVFVTFLGFTLWSFRRLAPAAPLFGLGVLLLPYVSLGLYNATYRFVLVCIPAFMMAGLLLRDRPRLARATIGIFALLLLVVSALFSQWYAVG